MASAAPMVNTGTLLSELPEQLSPDKLARITLLSEVIDMVASSLSRIAKRSVLKMPLKSSC